MTDRQQIVRSGGFTCCVDCYGVGDVLTIRSGARAYRFVMSDLFGPFLADRNGDPTNAEPTRAFLRAASLWNLQGRRLEGNAAIWHEPKKPVLEHISGRNYRVVEHGEEGHDW